MGANNYVAVSKNSPEASMTDAGYEGSNNQPVTTLNKVSLEELCGMACAEQQQVTELLRRAEASLQTIETGNGKNSTLKFLRRIQDIAVGVGREPDYTPQIRHGQAFSSYVEGVNMRRTFGYVAALATIGIRMCQRVERKNQEEGSQQPAKSGQMAYSEANKVEAGQARGKETTVETKYLKRHGMSILLIILGAFSLLATCISFDVYHLILTLALGVLAVVYLILHGWPCGQCEDC